MRKPNWESALERYCARCATVGFSYDRERGLDCCRFVFGAAAVMTGRALYGRFEGRYRSRGGAVRLMAEYGGAPSIEAAIPILMFECGFAEIEPARAQRGDALMLAAGEGAGRLGGRSMGIVSLDGRAALAMAERGLWRYPRTLSVRAWSIG